ncbi:MAG: hypothetical protein JO028_08595, partial [Acidobacteriaceae bacterium]|nr:hypothetical protein [Acidobacteriaceae bacterium]
MERPIDLPPAKTERRKLLATGMLFMVLSIGPAQEEMTPAKPVSFNTFIQSVKDADANDFLARPDSKVKDAASFEEMRQYILSMYHQVHVNHSYVLGSQTFDCVPVDQQPSVRALGPNRIATEPPATKRPQHLVAEANNDSGKTLGCEDHTIPMRRITLQQLSQF